MATMKFSGKQLKKAMIDADIKAGTLAEKIGKSRQTVFNYESEISKPDLEVLCQISVLLGKDISYFFISK